MLHVREAAAAGPIERAPLLRVFTAQIGDALCQPFEESVTKFPINGVARCRILALAGDAPPDGTEACRPTWTIVSLQQAVLEAEIVTHLSASTVWRILNQVDL